MWRFYYFVVMIIWCQSCFPSEAVQSNQNNEVELAALIDQANIEHRSLEILIDKSDYKLFILSNGQTIKEYPVVFGTNPIDDKRMEGDRCTPEGIFKVRGFYPHKSWQKFIWLDYPTSVSWEKHQKAKQDGLIPENADIGSEIGIHGVPEGQDHIIDEQQNWTWGCISLKNKDVNEIYPFIFEQMKVEIVP